MPLLLHTTPFALIHEPFLAPATFLLTLCNQALFKDSLHPPSAPSVRARVPGLLCDLYSLGLSCPGLSLSSPLHIPLTVAVAPTLTPPYYLLSCFIVFLSHTHLFFEPLCPSRWLFSGSLTDSPYIFSLTFFPISFHGIHANSFASASRVLGLRILAPNIHS